MLRLVRTPVTLFASLAAVLLACCAQQAATAITPLGTTTPSVVAHPSYAPIKAADACPAGVGVHLPEDVGSIGAAYFCVRETRPVPGDGEWQFLVVKGVTSGLGQLLAVYGTPDARPTTGACAAIYEDPRVVYLHLARTVAVRAPEDGCGQPAKAALRAFEALGTVDVTATRLNRVTSQLAQTSGCSDMSKDMLAIEEADGGPRQMVQGPTSVPPGAEVCVYGVARDPQGLRVGQLSSARQLTAAETAQINGELPKSAVDRSCARHQHTRFALLQPVGQAGGPTTLVALDGCAVQQDGGWWRASDRLRALVGA